MEAPNKPDEKRRAILKKWGDNAWAKDWIRQDHSLNFFSKIYAMANKYSFEEARGRINSAMAYRLSTGRVGVTKSWNPITGDLDKAYDEKYIP
jgi:hypothetical protein